MNFYLSSYKIGSKEAVEKLKNLIPFNKKTAYISNAFDFANDIQRRKENEEEDIKEIESIGLKIEYFDLRKYFNQPDNLEKDLKHFGVIWVSGGNVFVLRQAMKLSGFDQILIKLNQEKNNIL